MLSLWNDLEVPVRLNNIIDKFGANVDIIITTIKIPASTIKDFLLPSFPHCHPPQIDPVRLPMIMMLANREKSISNATIHIIQ